MERLPLKLHMPITPAVQDIVEAFIKRTTERGYAVVSIGTKDFLYVTAVKAVAVQPEVTPELAGVGEEQ